MDLPLTNSNMCNVRRVYNNRMGVPKRTLEWTHLFPTAKQASTHVAYEAAISLCTVTVLLVVLAVRQVVIAPVVRHCDRRTAPRSRLDSQGGVGDAVPRLRSGSWKMTPRLSSRRVPHAAKQGIPPMQLPRFHESQQTSFS
jgi:hypothetical protein